MTVKASLERETGFEETSSGRRSSYKCVLSLEEKETVSIKRKKNREEERERRERERKREKSEANRSLRILT